MTAACDRFNIFRFSVMKSTFFLEAVLRQGCFRFELPRCELSFRREFVGKSTVEWTYRNERIKRTKQTYNQPRGHFRVKKETNSSD